VTIALLSWVLKGVSFAEVWQSARQANWLYLGIAVFLATLSFGIRVPRWRILLHNDDGTTIPPGPLWHGIAIGFMANNLIPFRAGEVLRAVAINRLAKAGVASALSSLVAERLFDGITIIALLFVGLLTAGIPATAEINGFPVATLAGRLAIAPAVLLVACIATLAFPELAKRVVRAVIPSPKFAERLSQFIDGVRAGLGALTSPTRVLGAAAWSIVHWLNNALSFYIAFKAFGIEVGFGGALLMQSLLAVLIAVPSTPGYFGVFESAIKAVLIVLGIDGNTAVAYALTYHVTTFVPITLLGLWSLSRTPITLAAASEAPPPAVGR
jgi:uncharacterized protein (TIRG00374 family)